MNKDDIHNPYTWPISAIVGSDTGQEFRVVAIGREGLVLRMIKPSQPYSNVHHYDQLTQHFSLLSLPEER